MIAAQFQAVSPHPSYDEAVLDLGPVAHWQLGDLSGTTAKDFVTSVHDGTYTNSPTLGAAPLFGQKQASNSYGGASNQHVLVSDNAALDFTTDMSLLGWLNCPDAAAIRAWMDKRNVDALGYIILTVNTSGVVRLQMNNTGQLNGATNIGDATDRFVCGTHTGGNSFIFLDGVQDATGATIDAGAGVSNLFLGNNGNLNLDFTGRLGYVTLYNYAISLEQTDWLFRIGSGQDVSRGDYTKP